MTDNNNDHGKRFFEDMGKMFGSMMSSGMHSAMDAKTHAETWMEGHIHALLDRGAVVRREELDALYDTIRALEEREQILTARIEALEQNAAKTPSRKKRTEKKDEGA